ncbi:uncharacterized protein ACA1_150000 [Acanthamoeba castellanii str. Neff]|uniref:Right handed beta helix domain-containing protein n=1 Tax=Acanthamoeba castellanii (strain ATCC 30010 / Neff) TaxID=1257118 RepID=L8HC86_ACACF|nr:uncharacterized protein ACA1_150000 [Acanthamoeba castellanii str. Neff]ELR22810.1 hypothetical protein ACA1_150000 [Acanthamoeba castellanii str. Neff]
MLRSSLFALALACIISFHVQAATWVVDEGGKGNFTSLSGVTSAKVKPGDILRMRGTFTKAQVLQSINGTKAQPITITSYPGTTAVIDGATVPLSGGQGLLKLSASNHIVVENLLVRNSNKSGIVFDYSNNVLVRNTVVHNTWVRAIGGCGADVVIHNNTVYNAVMQNYNASSTTGWGQAMSVDNCFMPDDSTSRNWTFQHNTVYNSWGEGIDCIQVIGCTVRQNVVYNTFSVNIYIDNARDVLVDSNWVYSSNSFYYRRGKPATGVLVGAEEWPVVPRPTSNVTIQNNLLINTDGIAQYQEGTTYLSNAMNQNTVSGVRIFYNTIWNPSTKPTVSSGNVLKNNIFWVKRSAWQISNNVWVGVPRAIGGCGADVVIHNNTVYNAVMQNYNASSTTGWGQAMSYAHSPLMFNIFSRSKYHLESQHQAPFYWPAQPTVSSGNVLKNNIFWVKRSAWQISNNVWVGVPSVPTACADTTGLSSKAVANSSAIRFVGGGAGTAPANYVLKSTSPARAAGAVIPGISIDYYGLLRSTSAPSVGFAEYRASTPAAQTSDASQAARPAAALAVLAKRLGW